MTQEWEENKDIFDQKKYWECPSANHIKWTSEDIFEEEMDQEGWNGK